MTKRNGDAESDGHFFQSPRGDLVRAVESGRRRLMIGNVVGGLAAVLLMAAGLRVSRGHDAPSILLATMLVVVPLAVVSFSAYSQRRAWRARGDSTRGLVELTVELRKDEVRRMRFLRALAPAVLAVALLRAGLLWRSEAPTASLVGGAVPGLLMGLLFWRARQQIQREKTP